MNKKIGKFTYELSSPVSIIASGAYVGAKEGAGPFCCYFNNVATTDTMGEKTFEKAERKFFEMALKETLASNRLKVSDLDYVVGGDILNQLVSINYTARDYGLALVGLYGACSTMSESLAVASIMLSSGVGEIVACLTGSHFSAAERQYRNPLEFGNQRQTYSQWTATGAGCAVLSRQGEGPKITKVCFGAVTDYGISDIANMGAAMAPAAFETLKNFFADTGTSPNDYSLIATGDLGKLGADILRDLLKKEKITLGCNYMDCGHSLFREEQKTFQGGSGAGCSAIVFNTYIMQKLKTKEFKKVLLVATGALMSTTVNQQGETIPCVAHLVEIEA